MTNPTPPGVYDLGGWDRPLPTEVPEYAAYAAAGKAPVVPATPPPLSVTPTADSMVKHHLYTGVAGMLTWALALMIIVQFDLDQWWTRLLPVIGVIALAIWVRRGRRVSAVQEAEFLAGYTTYEPHPIWSRQQRRNYGQFRDAPHNYRGLWVLTPDGQVKSAPQPGLFPPGFYPSPTKPGMLEEWTGLVWGDRYRKP